MNVIFLDVDGVLNTHEFDPEVLCGEIHRDKVKLLNRVMKEADANIVLSSAWRYIIHRGEATLAGMEWLFRSHGLLAGRLIGYTPEDTISRGSSFDGHPCNWPAVNERGAQITAWLAENPGVSRYVAIDDLDLGITEAGHPLVTTVPSVGLTSRECAAMLRILKP